MEDDTAELPSGAGLYLRREEALHEVLAKYFEICSCRAGLLRFYYAGKEQELHAILA